MCREMDFNSAIARQLFWHGDWIGYMKGLSKTKLACILYLGANEEGTSRLIESSILEKIGHMGHFFGAHLKLDTLLRRKVTYVHFGGVNCANNHFFRYYLESNVICVQLPNHFPSHLFDIVRLSEETVNFYTFDESICSRYELHNSVELLWNERFPGSALLSLSDQDREHGYSTFRQFGLQPSDWFVTLHMRENSKYDESRNADVNSYIDAIQAVLDNGGWVIRLGSSDVSDLEFKHDRFIDYAKLGLRTDRLDVFLWAENRFMIGTSSGPLEIPPLFGKPVLWTNATAFGVNYFHRNSLVMPKLLISAENHNFRQLLEQGAYDVDHIPTRFKNVIHRDNTSDEIEMGVIEMIEGKTMIENEAQQSISDMLQIRGVYPTTTVSPYFARKHKEYFAL